MKRVLFLLPALLLLISCNTDQGITNLHVLAFNSQVVLEEGNDSEPMYFIVESDRDFDIGDISFISENEDVATVQFDNSAGTNTVYYKITAENEGKTNIYFSANNGQVVSESISVMVTNGTFEEAADYVQVFSQQDTSTAQTIEVSPECTYALNKNSKKFHDKNCSSVKTIKYTNYGEHFGTRDELLSQGYTPCKSCNP